MPSQASDKRPHLVLTNTSTAQPFTAHTAKIVRVSNLPPLDRATHGSALRTELATLQKISTRAVTAQKEIGLESGLGLQIQFVGLPDVKLAFESLGNERSRDPRKQIEVLSVREEGDATIANVFVPDGMLDHFEKYVTAYLTERTSEDGMRLLDHHALINTIASIRASELRALWTDELELPLDHTEPFWWEVWLPVRGRRELVISDFRKLAALAECIVNEHAINFPERTVVLMYGSQQQLTRSVMTLNCVAELRKAKDTAEFYSMPPMEQQEWVDETLANLNPPSASDTVPRVCLLDTGVNRGHPLLAPLIASDDLHTVFPAWGTSDEENHGTGLAGLAAYGDLSDVLVSSAPVTVTHRLESSKLTPSHGANGDEAKNHGYLFMEAVSRPEVSAPTRPRVFTSAVTSADGRDRGRPSAWSSTVDALASDYNGDGQFPRLFVLAAGNTVNESAWSAYPYSLSTNGIRDPAQSWNALTVGAYTNKVNITESDSQHWEPIAPDGGLSPYTTTSFTWDKAWPLKPDVVFERGNAGMKSAIGSASVSSLLLVTTHNQPTEKLLTTTNATSAASALGARMAAQLMAAYPALRPETIRALMVHSAEWTAAMKAAYLPSHKAPTKADYANLIRHCGWGAPNLDQAIWSAGNSLTLIVEDSVHPYQKDQSIKKKGIINRDMNLHALPWPKQQLMDLPSDTNVELRVTLSYFIEPNPSARGMGSKFYYPSHRLRFDVQRPLDLTTADFVARINAAATREDDGDAIQSKDSQWLLGDQQRNRGSLHQDVWRGTTAELANRNFMAVYPASGWWRERKALERYDLPARYSLLVSIRTPHTEVDLYTPVAQMVAQKVAVPVVAIES